MKHTKFAASAAILLCTVSLIGCGGTGETPAAEMQSNQTGAQTAPAKSEQPSPQTPKPEQDTQTADNMPANTDTSADTPAADSTEEPPADASAFLDSADMLGDVAALSENGFSLSPLTQSEDGTSSIAAADPSATASSSISIVYGETCSFQKASLNTETGKASYSDATRDDLKSQSSVAIYGKQQPSGEFLAEKVFLITYE